MFLFKNSEKLFNNKELNDSYLSQDEKNLYKSFGSKEKLSKRLLLLFACFSASIFNSSVSRWAYKSYPAAYLLPLVGIILSSYNNL